MSNVAVNNNFAPPAKIDHMEQEFVDARGVDVDSLSRREFRELMKNKLKAEEVSIYGGPKNKNSGLKFISGTYVDMNNDGKYNKGEPIQGSFSIFDKKSSSAQTFDFSEGMSKDLVPDINDGNLSVELSKIQTIDKVGQSTNTKYISEKEYDESKNDRLPKVIEGIKSMFEKYGSYK